MRKSKALVPMDLMRAELIAPQTRLLMAAQGLQVGNSRIGRCDSIYNLQHPLLSLLRTPSHLIKTRNNELPLRNAHKPPVLAVVRLVLLRCPLPA